MFCPFCLSEGIKLGSGAGPDRYRCPSCSELIPPRYVTESGRSAPVMISVVGFRGHGKTVYCASLFHLLRRGGLGQVWPEFFTVALNEESLDIVTANAEMLERGELPPSTVKNFPRPTILQVHGVPGYPPRTLLFYDTGGEVFERTAQMVRYAGFVARARAVVFLASIRDDEHPGLELHRLLNTYMIGLSELGGTPKRQKLVVVFTQADRWLPLLGRYPDLHAYLITGSLPPASNGSFDRSTLERVSWRLRQFALETLHAHDFVHAAESFFRSTAYCAVSALGAAPRGGRIQTRITPKRVLDPLIWLLEDSLTAWDRLIQRIRNWRSKQR